MIEVGGSIMSLGKKIQKLRKENKLSQEQLAQKCNVSRQTISRWESDEVLPDTNNLITLAKLFNVTLDSMVFDEKIKKEEIMSPKKKSIWMVLISFICVFSLGINIWFIANKNNSNDKNIYGTWEYKENGYEIKMTIIENKKSDIYDDCEMYLFYKADSLDIERKYKANISYNVILSNNEQGKLYEGVYGSKDKFYYNEDSYTVTLILNDVFQGKSEFVLKKMK